MVLPCTDTTKGCKSGTGCETLQCVYRKNAQKAAHVSTVNGAEAQSDDSDIEEEGELETEDIINRSFFCELESADGDSDT